MQQVKQERALIGRRLRDARERAGISREEAAEVAEVQTTAIDAWERGRSAPSLVQFRELCGLYGVLACHILLGVSPYGLSQEDAKELALAARAFSPGLQAKVGLLLALATVGTSQAEAQR